MTEQKPNRAMYVASINCWYHEACLPAHTPPVTRTIDLNDIAVIGSMPFEICAFCTNKVILSPGRVEKVLRSYPDKFLPDFEAAKHLTSQLVGSLVTSADNRKFYTCLLAFIQPDSMSLNKGKIIGICQTSDVVTTSVLTTTLQLARMELQQSTDPEQAKTTITSVINLIDSVIGPPKHVEA